MLQPCPDCGTIMQQSTVHDMVGSLTVLWECPACGMLWTPEQIELCYRLMGIAKEEESPNEPDHS
jgi:predicted RNA-binding Zn-ribbon protein involved in translation (DUF1610 family)